MKNKKLISKMLSDEFLQKITGQIFIGQAVLVAHEIGLFDVISKSPRNIDEIALELSIKKRAAQALISSTCVMKLVEHKQNGYQLSPLGEKYMDKSSPFYYGKVFDLLIKEHEIMNYEKVKESVLTNLSQVNQGTEIFTEKDSLSISEEFVAALHQKAIQPALCWTKSINLKKMRVFVDIGGGSGIHTIAVCLRNKNLEGIVCDRPDVLEQTKKYIKKFQLDDRIDTQSLDIFTNQFPIADVHFFGDIFHDWNREKCLQLALKSYNSLEKGGIIVLHEMFFNNKKTGPFLSASYNMKMLSWTEGCQYSKNEIKEILSLAGFKNIKFKKGLGNWSIVIGKKK